MLNNIAEAVIDNSKKTYSKENIEKYGREHGYSEEDINKVYENMQYKLDGAEYGVDCIKDTISSIKYTVDDLVNQYKNNDIYEDDILNISIEEKCKLKKEFFEKINKMIKIADDFSKENLQKVINWENGQKISCSDLLVELKTDICNYEACYINEDIIEEIPFQLFIELNNEVKRFIKVNQMLIYGIKNKNINIVEDAVNRFVNLLKKYKQ